MFGVFLLVIFVSPRGSLLPLGLHLRERSHPGRKTRVRLGALQHVCVQTRVFKMCIFRARLSVDAVRCLTAGLL